VKSAQIFKQKKGYKLCANFFHYFWAGLPQPSTPGLTCAIWARLNSGSPAPEFSRLPLSCFYFDSQFNAVRYFYSLLWAPAIGFVLLERHGKATGGATNICLVGIRSLSSYGFECQGITAFPVKQTIKQPKKGSLQRSGWLPRLVKSLQPAETRTAAVSNAQLTRPQLSCQHARGFCSVPKDPTLTAAEKTGSLERAKGPDMQTKQNQFPS